MQISKNHETDWKCNICERLYSSKNSLGNHNRNYHKNVDDIQKSSFGHSKVIFRSSESHLSVIQHQPDPLVCEFCKKKFKFKQGKFNHKKICKVKKKQEEESQNAIQTLMKENLELKQELKEKEASSSIEKKNFNNQNNFNSNNQTQNNIITYNFNSVEEKERVPYFLTQTEKIDLLTGPFYDFIPKLVEMVYCRFTQYKNVFISNLKSKHIYVYKDGKFIVDDKESVLNTLIENNSMHIQSIAIDIKENETSKPKKHIQNIIDKNVSRFNDTFIRDDEFFNLHENTRYKTFENYNKQKIVLLLYNNQKQIKEKCALFSDMQLTEEQISEMIESQQYEA